MKRVKTVRLLVEAGKATPGPPVGPALGQLKLNVSQVVKEINEKTKEYEGLRVPVIIEVDTSTKTYSLKIGVPPASALLKMELSASGGKRDLSIEQIVKVAKKKMQGMRTNNLKTTTKSILGTCLSMGILVEGRSPKEITKRVNEGEYDDILH